MSEEQIIDAAAPVIHEPPAPAESTGGEQETTEQANVQQGSKPKGGFQKRIDRLVSRNYTAQAEAEFWKQRALESGVAPLSDDQSPEEWRRRRDAQIKAGTSNQPETAEASEGSAAEGEKSEQESEADVELREGIAQDLVRRGASVEDARAYAKHAVESTRALEQAHPEHAERLAAAREWYPDFESVVAASAYVLLSMPLLHEIAALDNSADVAVALVRRPDIADALGKLAPNAAKSLLRELSASLNGEDAPAEPAKRAAPTPAPIRPVKKAAPTATGLSDDDSIEVWRAKREAQIARQQKRR